MTLDLQQVSLSLYLLSSFLYSSGILHRFICCVGGVNGH